MDFVLVEKKQWNTLQQEIVDIKSMLTTLLKLQDAPLPSKNEYISIEDAIKKYRVSRKTLNLKAKGFGVTRLRIGKQNLMLEAELFEALKHPSPKPEIFKQQQIQAA